MEKEIEYINDEIKTLEYHIANPIEYNITPTIKVKINDSACYEDKLKILNNIKQALLKAQEQKKALEIIKEKEVDVNLLNIRHSAETYNDDYYKIHYSYDVVVYLLTEEEFNLLKEILKCI
jgi:hypothetical protein